MTANDALSLAQQALREASSENNFQGPSIERKLEAARTAALVSIAESLDHLAEGWDRA